MKLNLSLIEPVAIGAAAVTRAGWATYYDKNGNLATAVNDQLRLSYNPSDLSAAPYALLEPAAATNCLPNNTMAGAVVGGALPTFWNIGVGSGTGVSRSVAGIGTENGIDYIDIAFTGTSSGTSYFWINICGSVAVAASAGQIWCGSMFAKIVSGNRPSQLYASISGRNGAGAGVEDSSAAVLPDGGVPLSQCRIVNQLTLSSPNTGSILQFVTVMFAPGEVATATIRIGLPQLEQDRVTSPIRTSAGPITRPADVLGPNFGLIYSSLTENDADDAPLYDPAHTYAAGDRVRRAETHRVYESNVAGNLGNTPEQNATGDTAKWLDLRPTNKWAMFDGDTSTQSAAASTLTVVLRPGAINALYGAGIDADLVQVCVQDAPGGDIILNYSEALEASAPGDYDEYFWGRFKPKTDFLVTGVDQYHQCVVTVTLTKTAGTVKCGVLLAGDQIPLAASQRGAKAKPRSYSYIKTDDFGNTTIKRRRATTDLSGTAWVERAEASWVEGVIQRVLDVPVVVIVSDDAQDYGLRGYGLLSAEISWDQPQDCLLSFSLQGLINATTDSAA
jgi:hypothetical protein